MTTLLALLLGLTIYLLALGTVTMLLAWLISGHRSTVWSAIKANFFFALTALVVGTGAFASSNALTHHLPWQAALIVAAFLIIMGLIVIPCWVFAHYLEINTLQAFAVLLLLWMLSTVTGLLLNPYLPADMRQHLPKTQMTQTTALYLENSHA
ncbi:MAG: hypothetical protein ACRERR_15155 [Moraxellaceae bacterium]